MIPWGSVPQISSTADWSQSLLEGSHFKSQLDASARKQQTWPHQSKWKEIVIMRKLMIIFFLVNIILSIISVPTATEATKASSSVASDNQSKLQQLLSIISSGEFMNSFSAGGGMKRFCTSRQLLLAHEKEIYIVASKPLSAGIKTRTAQNAGNFVLESQQDTDMVSSGSIAVVYSISRLPKITLPTFDRNPLNWQSVWDSYRAAVHHANVLDV